VFDDYENQMNIVDNEMNKLFNLFGKKYDEEPRQLKQFNQEEDFTHENCAILPFTKEKEERRKNKEEKRKEIGRTLALESGINPNKNLTNNVNLLKLESSKEEINEILRTFLDNEKNIFS
jgi:hypothetical protein